jgi:hypothetical protein
MSREAELAELWAYLDRLELDEQLEQEQEQVDVSLGLGHSDTGINSALDYGLSPHDTQYSTPVSSSINDTTSDKATTTRCLEPASPQSPLGDEQQSTPGKHTRSQIHSRF